MNLLAQAPPPSFWNAPNGSTELWMKIVLALVVGILFVLGLSAVPSNLRRPIIAGFTFLSGLFYVLLWLWPQAIDRHPDDKPLNAVEGMAFWLEDALPHVANFSNILSAFLLGLGVFSVLRIHFRRISRQQRDWGYSVVLLAFMVAMVVFGYWDWINRTAPKGELLAIQSNWHFQQFASDLLFNGLLQQMDAAMFSMVAFYILSAAYRAFRVRSLEATILLGTALIVILSLMGAVEFAWNNMFAGHPNASLTEIYKWIQNTVQTPSIRGIDFGVGIGALSMGLRIWLSLEKEGGN